MACRRAGRTGRGAGAATGRGRAVVRISMRPISIETGGRAGGLAAGGCGAGAAPAGRAEGAGRRSPAVPSCPRARGSAGGAGRWRTCTIGAAAGVADGEPGCPGGKAGPGPGPPVTLAGSRGCTCVAGPAGWAATERVRSVDRTSAGSPARRTRTRSRPVEPASPAAPPRSEASGGVAVPTGPGRGVDVHGVLAVGTSGAGRGPATGGAGRWGAVGVAARSAAQGRIVAGARGGRRAAARGADIRCVAGGRPVRVMGPSAAWGVGGTGGEPPWSRLDRAGGTADRSPAPDGRIGLLPRPPGPPSRPPAAIVPGVGTGNRGRCRVGPAINGRAGPPPMCRSAAPPNPGIPSAAGCSAAALTARNDPVHGGAGRLPTAGRPPFAGGAAGRSGIARAPPSKAISAPWRDAGGTHVDPSTPRSASRTASASSSSSRR